MERTAGIEPASSTCQAAVLLLNYVRMRLGRDSVAAPLGPLTSARPLVEELEQVVRRQLDVLVPPLRGAVDAGDQAAAVHALEVAVHEGVAGFRLVSGTVG